MVIQVMCVSKFLPLFILRRNLKQENNQINIYKCFANKQIDISGYTADNSYKKIKESTIYMFFWSPSVFYYYLKRK